MEWIETLGTLEPKDVIYTDYVQKAKELLPKLQAEVCDDEPLHLHLYSPPHRAVISSLH